MVMKRVLLFIVLASMILVGCKTTEKIVYVEVPKVEKEYVYLERRDTAYQKDSVFIKEFVKGDTVKVVEYRYRDRFHETTRIDTITRVDSCVVKVPVEVVKIDHKQTYFQKSFMWLGIFTLLGFFGWIAYLILKSKYGWFKNGFLKSLFKK